jgi:hypothetical protein
LEDKILVATQQAAQIASIFSPAAGAAVAAGVSVEPVISGLVKMIAGLFHHHSGIKPAGGTH